MESSKITIVKPIVSNQKDEHGQPYCDLKTGDIIEFKGEDVFFTRKLKLMPFEKGKDAFDSILRANS